MWSLPLILVVARVNQAQKWPWSPGPDIGPYTNQCTHLVQGTIPGMVTYAWVVLTSDIDSEHKGWLALSGWVGSECRGKSKRRMGKAQAPPPLLL